MVMMEMVSMKPKGRQRADLAESPLLSSPSSDIYCMFSVSPPPRREIARGFIYSVLGQDNYVKAKKVWKGSMWWKMGPTTWLGSGTMWWTLFSTSWLLTLTFSSQDLCFLEKLMWQKYWVHLTLERSLYLKNTEKQGFLFCRVKTKIKGIF
jgi:hypothetical protein